MIVSKLSPLLIFSGQEAKHSVKVSATTFRKGSETTFRRDKALNCQKKIKGVTVGTKVGNLNVTTVNDELPFLA